MGIAKYPVEQIALELRCPRMAYLVRGEINYWLNMSIHWEKIGEMAKEVGGHGGWTTLWIGA